MIRTLVLALFATTALAQEAPPNGPRRIDPGWHALVGATVHVRPGQTVTDATIVLKAGRIVSVSRAAPPPGARVWDRKGHHIYAGFIDAFVSVDAPDVEPRHWNSKVTPLRRARRVDKETAEQLRKLGFTAALATPKNGIFRGRASLVSLAPEDSDRSVPRPGIYAPDLFQVLAFERFKGAKEGYPTSQMGAIAVIRQGLYDGIASGESFAFDTADELEALRAARIGREFERKAILLGSGFEFRRLDAIVKDGLAVVAPLRFPNAPVVDSVGGADEVDLRDMMAWEQAPTNVRRLDDAGVVVALTSARMGRRTRFHRNLRLALRHGLRKERALAMLTTNPASMLGVADRMGTVEAGRLANLVVTDGGLFDRYSKIRAVWIEGRRIETEPKKGEPVEGTWALTQVLPPGPRKFTFTVDRRDSVEVLLDDKKKPGRNVRRVGNRFGFVVGKMTLSGVVNGETMRGHATTTDGVQFSWAAKRTGAAPESKKRGPQEPIEVPVNYGYPFGPYALEKLPAQQDAVFYGATIWTCGPDGIIESGLLHVSAGVVKAIGKWDGKPVPGGIDARGKHITPGIVDCHSHTGISKGINDSGQAVTAEVRIGDVTNPDHISWYRQLAGGVTTVNSLHGSANPIGGQNQVNKVRWGVRHPDEMHFEGAIPGIKFALGENVKQSNWGDDYTTRYPQTRMGVEAIMRDRFIAAREYLNGPASAKATAGKPVSAKATAGKPVSAKATAGKRVDLELEALGEILQGKRLIHCHSYRQDEILMLCRIAEEFGFKIGTFQHVLEGYKVARAIRKNAIGASAFSDWWAYKVEVQDAVPYNGPIMHDQGVVVSFNSDSDELARRLNVEAAKAVKYGGIAPAEAFKFVTLNAARQLRIDDRVGSLETGKHADFAVWSKNPLSPYARCERTWIDGREYFSLEQDRAHRETIAKERLRLIARILESPETRRRDRKKKRDEDEDDPVEDDDPEFHECGMCGVWEARR